MNPITYCMNVHPGEDVASVQQALVSVTLPVREAFHAKGEFPLGFRFGAELAETLRIPERVKQLATYMKHNRLTTIGINGFSYGAFHGGRVKTSVYEPDWADPRRVAYTRSLFYTLSQLPPTRTVEGHPMSVTTVPLGYNRGEEPSELMFKNLCDIALFLRKLEGFTGQRLCLALEPEPDCLLESTQSIIDFFEKLWLHPEWNPAYRDYIGVCFDTCHFALAYEDPLCALRSLVFANIPVTRIQVSAALEFSQYATAEDFEPFFDEVYLHQTRRREADASLLCFEDLTRDILPELLGTRGRIHYHVPLTWTGNGRMGSTRNTLTPAFWRYVRAGGWPVEVETYTYFVYPEHLRHRTLSESLLADMAWVREQLRHA